MYTFSRNPGTKQHPASIFSPAKLIVVPSPELRSLRHQAVIVFWPWYFWNRGQEYSVNQIKTNSGFSCYPVFYLFQCLNCTCYKHIDPDFNNDSTKDTVKLIYLLLMKIKQVTSSKQITRTLRGILYRLYLGFNVQMIFKCSVIVKWSAKPISYCSFSWQAFFFWLELID